MEFFRCDFLAGEGAGPMKASKCLDARKAFVLKEGDDGIPVAEIYKLVICFVDVGP